MNPDKLFAGYDSRRTYTLENYSAADGWSVTVRLIGSGGSADIDAINAEGSGTAWTLTVPAAALSALTSGVYTLQLIAADGTTTEIAVSETVQVIAASETDLRSSARKQLDAIDAVLEGKASKDESSISYNGRSISRMSWEELQTARDRIARNVRDEERRAAGKKKIQSVTVGFKYG